MNGVSRDLSPRYYLEDGLIHTQDFHYFGFLDCEEGRIRWVTNQRVCTGWTLERQITATRRLIGGASWGLGRGSWSWNPLLELLHAAPDPFKPKPMNLCPTSLNSPFHFPRTRNRKRKINIRKLQHHFERHILSWQHSLSIRSGSLHTAIWRITAPYLCHRCSYGVEHSRYVLLAVTLHLQLWMKWPGMSPFQLHPDQSTLFTSNR